MDLKEYREHQIEAIELNKKDLEAIKTRKMRFFSRDASHSTDVDITDEVIDRRLKHIDVLQKIVEMLDREIARGK